MLKRRCLLEERGFDDLLDALGFAFMGMRRSLRVRDARAHTPVTSSPLPADPRLRAGTMRR
jgi:hypothetical protein